MLEVVELYKRVLDLLQEEDGPLMSYLHQSNGGHGLPRRMIGIMFVTL